MKKLLLIFLIFQTVIVFGQSGFYFNQDLPCVNKQFNIYVHVINNEQYRTATENDVKDAIERANELFAPICISFKFCEMDTVFNYNYRYICPDDMRELRVLYAHHNRINLFVTHTFEQPFMKEYCLGSVDSMNYAGLFINDPLALPQVLGHFFGLSHTYENSEGLELVDGSNCKTTGDKICDTPADPYPEYDVIGNYIDDECVFFVVKKDVNGDIYLPDVTNIMSNYFPCQCKFSVEQYKKMAENYFKASKKHW